MTMKALVEAAVVGTGRQPDRANAALDGDQPIDELVARVDSTLAIERRVLLAAAVTAIYEQAGRLAPTDVEPLPVADAEVHPVCSAPATALLAELIGSNLMSEALECLDRAGLVVAPGLLPVLLEKPDDRIARVLPKVMGARGRWLCAIRNDCSWLADNAPDDAEAARLWQEGPYLQRITVLAARRTSDPATAREWLAATWAQESAENREAFLKLLGSNLGAADVAFLEAALSDRSARVRIGAVRLLARIADNETARRVTERADALFHYAQPSRGGIGSLLKRAVLGAPVGTLTATPVIEYDPVWERDGIISKVPDGAGARAHWLTEALGVVPPEHWERRFGAPAKELVRAALASEWKHAILYGWSHAAMVFHNGAWATVLWDAWREMELDDTTTKYESMVRREMITLLFKHLPRADIEARVLALMEQPAADVPLTPMALFHAVPTPWSVEFGRALLRRFAPHLERESVSHQHAWVDSLPVVALNLAVETFADALAVEQRAFEMDGRAPAFRLQHIRFRQTVQLRQRIHEEIPT